MVAGRRWHLEAGSLFLLGKILPNRRFSHAAEADYETAAGNLRRRRIRSCEGINFGTLRCLRHSWRSALADSRKIADMSERRERKGLPKMLFGVAAFSIVRDTEREAARELNRITDVKQSAAGYDNYRQWLAGTNLDRKVSLEDYSVTNRGLASGLVGTPERVRERVAEFEDAGADLLLLQCSPQLEEMERFAETVIRRKMATSPG